MWHLLNHNTNASRSILRVRSRSNARRTKLRCRRCSIERRCGASTSASVEKLHLQTAVLEPNVATTAARLGYTLRERQFSFRLKISKRCCSRFCQKSDYYLLNTA